MGDEAPEFRRALERYRYLVTDVASSSPHAQYGANYWRACVLVLLTACRCSLNAALALLAHELGVQRNADDYVRAASDTATLLSTTLLDDTTFDAIAIGDDGDDHVELVSQLQLDDGNHDEVCQLVCVVRALTRRRAAFDRVGQHLCSDSRKAA